MNPFLIYRNEIVNHLGNIFFHLFGAVFFRIRLSNIVVQIIGNSGGRDRLQRGITGDPHGFLRIYIGRFIKILAEFACAVFHHAYFQIELEHIQIFFREKAGHALHQPDIANDHRICRRVARFFIHGVQIHGGEFPAQVLIAVHIIGFLQIILVRQRQRRGRQLRVKIEHRLRVLRGLRLIPAAQGQNSCQILQVRLLLRIVPAGIGLL